MMAIFAIHQALVASFVLPTAIRWRVSTSAAVSMGISHACTSLDGVMETLQGWH